MATKDEKRAALGTLRKMLRTRLRDMETKKPAEPAKPTVAALNAKAKAAPEEE